jgi:hypothetical protein
MLLSSTIIAMVGALTAYTPAETTFHGVHILTTGSGSKSAPGASADWTERIGPFNEPAVLFISADARTDYEGPPTTTGLHLRLVAEKEVLSEDTSWPAQVSGATAMSTGKDEKLFLPAGASVVIGALVSPTGDTAAGTRTTNLTVRVLAISANSN